MEYAENIISIAPVQPYMTYRYYIQFRNVATCVFGSKSRKSVNQADERCSAKFLIAIILIIFSWITR